MRIMKIVALLQLNPKNLSKSVLKINVKHELVTLFPLYPWKLVKDVPKTAKNRQSSNTIPVQLTKVV